MRRRSAPRLRAGRHGPRRRRGPLLRVTTSSSATGWRTRQPRGCGRDEVEPRERIIASALRLRHDAAEGDRGFVTRSAGRSRWPGEDTRPGADRAVVFQEFDQLFRGDRARNVAYPLRVNGRKRERPRRSHASSSSDAPAKAAAEKRARDARRRADGQDEPRQPTRHAAAAQASDRTRRRGPRSVTPDEEAPAGDRARTRRPARRTCATGGGDARDGRARQAQAERARRAETRRDSARR